MKDSKTKKKYSSKYGRQLTNSNSSANILEKKSKQQVSFTILTNINQSIDYLCSNQHKFNSEFFFLLFLIIIFILMKFLFDY